MTLYKILLYLSFKYGMCIFCLTTSFIIIKNSAWLYFPTICLFKSEGRRLLSHIIIILKSIKIFCIFTSFVILQEDWKKQSYAFLIFTNIFFPNFRGIIKIDIYRELKEKQIIIILKSLKIFPILTKFVYGTALSQKIK